MMNNEETILDEQLLKNNIVENKKETQVNPEPVKNEQSQAASASKPQGKKGTSGEKWAYGAAGAVVGAGATMTAQAVAANMGATPEVTVETAASATTVEASEPDVQPTVGSEPAVKPTVAHESASAPIATDDVPNPEDAIIVTDDGVRVAHVNDNLPFGQAFAEARAQVGAGGVFEWNGKVYSTYYKDEWEAMSPQERAEYQASIDYEDVMGDTQSAHNHTAQAQENLNHVHSNEAAGHNTNAHHVHNVNHEHHSSGGGNGDNADVHIIAAGQTDWDGNGEPEYSVVVDYDGHEVLIVDVDMDGMGDLLAVDTNGDGQLSDGEIVDISGEDVQMPGYQPDMQVNGNMYAQNDMPDYMNDADAGAYMA